MLYRFYYIRCDETNDIYLGKTKQKLPTRFKLHIIQKNCTSRIITQYESCVIILLEEVECTKKESIAIERAYIETYVCVNKIIPGRTYKEWREYYKVELAEQRKEIINKNKSIRYTCECGKELCINCKSQHNKTDFHINFYKKEEDLKKELELKKENLVIKRNEISKKRKEKYTCECGKISNYDHKARHERSQFHKNFCLNIK